MEENFRIDKNSIFTNEEKQFIIDNYATMTADEMKDVLVDKTAKQIRGYAHSKGLKKEKQYRYFTEEEKQYIIDNYNIISNPEIAKSLGVTTKKVNDFGYSHGLLTSEFKVNENYFKTIDTEHKAYWLGFLYADGCVVEGKKKKSTPLSLQLSLAKIDKNHIEKFNKDIESNYKITDHTIKNKYFSSRITISNTEFSKNLIDKGCVPRKSLILTFPTEDIVPNNLIHHFIRGYFDGDGCIHVNKNKDTYSVSFVGTEDFLTTLQNIVFNEVGISKINIQNKGCGKAYQTGWGGINTCKQWYDYLYKNATIWLDRKYDKFQEFVNINYGFVYILTCLADGKQFIGKKKYDNCGQWEDYIGGDSEELRYAIKKYGKDNFKREIIENCTTRKELKEREKYWIDFYNAYINENFYNIPLEDKKPRKAKVICLNTMEIFNSITEASKKYYVNFSSISACCSGKVYTAGTLNNESLRWEYYEVGKEYTHEPYNPSNYIKVVCLNDTQVFNSIREASIYYNMSENKNSIKDCCEGKFRYAGIHPETGDCLVWMFYDDYIKLDDVEFKKVYKNKRVKCINTGEIFDSLEKAREWCGLKSIAHISSCCIGSRKIAGKHPITNEQLKWEYID